jgi:hypothetical protein
MRSLSLFGRRSARNVTDLPYRLTLRELRVALPGAREFTLDLPIYLFWEL